MSTAMTTLGIDKLSPAERVELLHDIWDSLRPAEDARDLTDPEKAMLDARLAARDANPGAGASWDEVKARVLGGRWVR